MTKCTVAGTYPDNSLAQAIAGSRCVLGISLNRKQSEGQALAAQLEWMTQHFRECRVLLGDLLQRFNALAYEGLSEADALKQSGQLGDLWLTRNSRYLLATGKSLEVIRWDDLLKHPRFEVAHDAVMRSSASDSHVAQAISEDAAEFVERQLGKCAQGSIHASALDCSRQYLLEEAAAYVCLASEGWNVDAYPGMEPRLLRALTEIAPAFGLPDNFASRVNIRLQIRTNGGSQ